jgi:general secretion pathway protein F
MPVYRYQGVDKKGKKAVGTIDAENERAARQKLRKTNIFPTHIAASGTSGAVMVAGQKEFSFASMFQKIKPQDIALMTRQLASLLNAGVPLVEALAALMEQLEHPKLRASMGKIKDDVTEGGKLSDAMRKHPTIFNDLYVNMVNAGEASGTLEKVLERIADVTEAQAKLRAKIVGALTYPAIMGIVGLMMMVMLITFVIPKMTQMLIEMEIPLPMPTRFLIWLTDQVFAWWWLILLLIGGTIFGVKKWVVSTKGRRQFDTWTLKAPLVGKLVRLATVARLTRTLSTLLQGGVQMLPAMDIVKNIVSNVVLKQVLAETRDAVSEGSSLADPLKKSGHFPPLATHMIAIGEKTGELESMMVRVADTYEDQVDNTIGSLMGLIEPVMLVVMGGMVAFIVISVMYPMLQASQSMMQ